MRYGVSIPNFGSYVEPGTVTELAVAADDSGWDGFFVWDHIVIGNGVPVADPWVLLGAIAAATERVELGPMVTPIPRRRPWVLARQATTVDHLSDGRLILGVGIGFPPEEEFGTFGEPTDARERADMLDEGLAVIEGMWSPAPFAFEGSHYTVSETQFAPAPRRGGGIPIWVAATFGARRPMRRAVRFAGLFPVKMDFTDWTTDEVASLRRDVVEHRGSAEGFEIVIGGRLEAGRDLGEDYEAAGATWYLAGPPPAGAPEAFLTVVAAGPPRRR